MLSRFIVEIIKQSELNNFFTKKYKPTFDFGHTEEVFKRTLEMCFDNDIVPATNIIHACYDIQEERYCGFLNIGTTVVDDLASIAVEFVFVEKEYRKIPFDSLNKNKLSEYLLIDYTVGDIGLSVKEKIGINTIALVPINEKVRSLYEEMGFLSIEKSGKNEFEDWMVFNI